MGRSSTEVVGGRYRLRTQLGRGGMGVVWRAHDERLDREVALKVLHPWVADDADLRARFEREASALARLEHPNVVRLYDVIDDDGATVLVMELVEGDSLAALVAGRTLPWDEVRALLAPVAAALAHAHARGVVHRDLTPANILVERGTGRLVVTDFGLARLARSAGSIPASGVLAGTPEYWAPEQAAGRATGPATDLYALGTIAFRLVAGRVPVLGEDRLAAGLRRAHEPAPSLATLAPGAPAEAVQLVDRLLDADPALRPDALDTARALGCDPALLPHQTTASLPLPDADAAPTLELETRVLRRPAETQPRPQKARRRGRTALVALAASLVLGLGGAVYAVASDPPPGVDAPDATGAGVDAARAEVGRLARAEGVAPPTVKVVDRSYSESVPAGRVIAQDPAPGERIVPGGALLVSVSRGTAYADVPSVAGLATEDAVALLERSGFTPSRRYAPSTQIAAWHALDSDPAPGTRIKRPARVVIVVSTGPPRLPVPSVAGLDADDAAETLRDAGFAAVIEERASDAPVGTVLGLDPASGTRAPQGSSVRVLVAREPVWDPVTETAGEDSATTGPLAVPAGARLVLETDNRSFLGLFGASVVASWSGDAQGSTEARAGDDVILVEPTSSARTIEVTLTVDGDAAWRVVVEAPR